MRALRLSIAAAVAALCVPAAVAADVTRPAEVSGLAASKSGSDVSLSWSAVIADVTGAAETVSQYRVYRGTTPDFVPDKSGGTNRIGSPAGTTFDDTGALGAGSSYYYLVSAVDAAGNEGATKATAITVPPILSGSYTDTGIDLSWTAAQPIGQVFGYRVYYGTASHRYDFIKDVGLATSTSLTGLSANVNYYAAVVAVDLAGNESAFSNEHVDAVAGRITFKVHDQDYLCWGAGNCPPKPGEVQRNDGWQLMAPANFPEGNWKKVTLTFTMDSRLCSVGQQGTTDKCGSTNPGGYNPCGDPWDRIATVFLVLDNCIAAGGSCATNDNVELIHAITPFGTDAAPPNGSGIVPPRVLTFDVTPLLPLLQGQKYIGAEIDHFVQAGWHVTTQFNFSKRPEEASTKPPAAGIAVVGFGGAPLPVRTVTVPAGATKVVARLFTTGHGGTLYCDGGSNNGASCTSSANCPGGSCQNCDEFCHRTNRILKNGSPVYTVVPFRTDCSPGSITACTAWNACGWPSCTFSRAGWCPGYLACTSNTPGCDQDIDVTALFPPGGTYDVGYDVLIQRGSWAVSMLFYWY